MKPLHPPQPGAAVATVVPPENFHGDDEVTITLRHFASPHCGGVELRGELESWWTPIPMRPVAAHPGLYETRRTVAPGVYSYKFRHGNGSWHLDADNPRTRSVDGVHELVTPHAQSFDQAMEELRAIVRGTSLVLVDHRAPPRGCRCLATRDPDLTQFLTADAFANRANFDACRLPWEQACIDPDGTVHAVAYEAPALGTLAETSFLELWNSPVAQAVRAEALRGVSPELRERCPGSCGGSKLGC